MNSFLVNLPLFLIAIGLLAAVVVVVDSEKRPRRKGRIPKSSPVDVIK